MKNNKTLTKQVFDALDFYDICQGPIGQACADDFFIYLEIGGKVYRLSVEESDMNSMNEAWGAINKDGGE